MIDLLGFMRSSALTSTGALCLVAAAPTFLAANVVVGLGWHDPAFSWATNNISDLGNVTCGVWDTTRPRYVCSPWHDAMNLAFVPTSLLLVSGLLLTRRAWGTGGTSRAARWMLLAGSAGFGLAGVAPADTHENLHLLAALLIFACGNLGLIMAGFARTGMLLSSCARSRWCSARSAPPAAHCSSPSKDSAWESAAWNASPASPCPSGSASSAPSCITRPAPATHAEKAGR